MTLYWDLYLFMFVDFFGRVEGWGWFGLVWKEPPSLRVYPFYICPAAPVGLVPYQNHIKPIYGPYMGHPHSKNWTLDFSPRFSWAHDRIFRLLSGFPLQITWLPVSWARDPFFQLLSGFPFQNTWLPIAWARDPLSNPRSAVALPVSNHWEPIRSQHWEPSEPPLLLKSYNHSFITTLLLS